MPEFTRRDFIKRLCGAFLALSLGQESHFLARWTQWFSSEDPSLLEPPFFNKDFIQGIYVPGWQAVSHKGIDNLAELIAESSLNTLMIDVKNGWGELFYTPRSSMANKTGCQARTKEGRSVSIDFDYLREAAQKHGIRLIARHVMFKDAALHESRLDLRISSREGEKWADPRKDEVVDYNLSLLAEEAELGFDEIVLDYIRFPAVGDFGSDEEKCRIIDGIVEKVALRLAGEPVELGVQVFGYAAWDHRKAGVGQRLETLDPHVSTIYPMLYPSHFWPGSFGYDNPGDYPYEIIVKGFRAAVGKVKTGTRIIPMVQAFWYSGEEIIEQMKAAYEERMPGYICWNPAGNYRQFQAPPTVTPRRS